MSDSSDSGSDIEESGAAKAIEAMRKTRTVGWRKSASQSSLARRKSISQKDRPALEHPDTKAKDSAIIQPLQALPAATSKIENVEVIVSSAPPAPPTTSPDVRLFAFCSLLPSPHILLC